ncbi:MAG: hypothetical protein CSB49_03090 [Proteobacteria bacterium]|nr:MAG: hypothetical protein CSB49_03090 [Pseudomonadota bacterium]
MMSERFGKYELLQRIGVGGMAEVWVARTYGAQGFVKELVIKRILEQFNQDDDFVHMFINEARLASRLQHANIVQIFDFDQVDGVYYIAMELVDGPDLRKVAATARRREMPVPQTLAVHVGVEALKGLHYAHTRQERGEPLGIVHRDISPHNLLLSYAGEVKVTDFGIAKVAALASATRTGMVKGKLTYMSPEQVRGERVDARADLCALGIVLWELLAGRRLYGGVGSEGELLAAARRGKVLPLAEVAPSVPLPLAQVVERMLAPDPTMRFESAAAALAELSAFSGATAGLEVAEYLAQLLPGGERERRGQTTLEKAPGVAVAPADAPTGTLDEEQAAEQAAEPSSVTPTSASTPEAASRRRAGWGISIVVGLLIFAAAGAAGFWAMRRSRAIADRAPDAAEVELRCSPSGARVEVDGVALAGGSPYRVVGRRGQTLSVVARWGAQKVERSVELGGQPSVALERRAPAPAKADSAPSKASPDAGRIPDARLVAGSKRLPRTARRTKQPRRISWPKVPTRRPADASVKKISRSPKTERSGHKRPPKAYGMLAVYVDPWAFVSVDGGRRMTTPIKALRLPVGVHRLTLSNTAIKQRVKKTVKIRKGQTTAVRLNWSR